ncbi:MAG TPA: cohesin domain-containing protein [Candidatus Paceibacterota bacterium]
MKISKKILYSFVLLIISFLFSQQVNAATLELALEKDITSTNSDVVVLVTLNSEDQDVNTAQATISFPPSLLEVTKIDKTDSVLSFWLQEPVYDNAKGTINFVGGSTSGFKGPSLKIMKIDFKVKGSGTGRLGITNGAITASDGTGSNVYNTAKGLDINIPTTSDFQAVKVERAQQAITLAKKLPAIPSVDVPFYPDSTKWNNRSASFQAKWNIGSDIVKAGFALDKSPSTVPKESTEALTGMKVFPAFADGVWYLHLRQANNVGWSPVLHYRIALDTTPPSSFNITSIDSFKTDNPKPTINYKSSDLISGINNYVIKLDGVIIFTTDKNTYQFSPILPGIHSLIVEAIDNTNNSTSETQSLEILPIESPIISYVSRQVIVNEENITAGGTSSIKGEVLIKIENSQKQVVFDQTVPIDNNGNWNTTIDKNLPTGDYRLLATARDENMASSLPVSSETISIKLKPLLVLGGVGITQTWFFIILIIILLCSFSAGWFSYRKWRGQLERRTIIAQRDVSNILDNISTDINKMLKNYADGDLSESDKSEMEFTLKKMKSNLEKSQSYIVDNIREINK